MMILHKVALKSLEKLEKKLEIHTRTICTVILRSVYTLFGYLSKTGDCIQYWVHV